MPKTRSKRRTYRAPPRKKPKPSPRWFGMTILGLMAAGVAIIVLNYLGLMPNANHQASNLWLFTGLGLIAAGFLAATQWR